MYSFYKWLSKPTLIFIFFMLFLNSRVCATEPVISSTTKNSLQDVSIVIASCDKYSGLWNPFFTLLFKNWPSIDHGENNSVPIFLISNTKKFEHPRVQNILFPNEISWSDNMLETLAQVKTKYILYLQEDYFLTKPVNEQLLESMLAYMKDHDAAFLEVAGFNNNIQTVKQKVLLEHVTTLGELNKHSLYRTSLQAGIWSKDKLAWLIKPGENAVGFEISGSKRSEGMSDLFLANIEPEHDPIQYLNVVHRGLLLKSAVDYIHQQGINFDPKLHNLRVDQDHPMILFKRKIIGYLRTASYLKKFREVLRDYINDTF